MKLILPESWVPSDGIVLEENADRAIRARSHVLVIAGPGAGKTELLAQKAAYLFQTNICRDPRKILAISFKTDAAQNLRERVEKRCGKDIKFRFSSMTYDAFAKSILDHFMYALPEALRPSPDYLVNDYDIIDAAFKKAGYNNPEGLPPSKLRIYYDYILSKGALTKMRDDLGFKVWMLLSKGFDDNSSTLTFKMIGTLADLIIQTNPKIRHALQLTYSHVFLDEFQDTTGFQYEFVKHCFFDSKTKITAVGDNKQRIMLWAGALPGIFKKFFEEFSPEGVRLVMNHRSAPRLVALQKSMYDSLKERTIEVIPSDKWNPDDGDISLFISDDEIVEGRAVAEDIAKKISEGTAPREICILCKQLPINYCARIISDLNGLGIRARIENEYQDLLKEPIVELTLNIMSCALNRKQPQKWEDVESKIMEIWNIDSSCANEQYEKLQTRLFSEIENIKYLMLESEGNNLSEVLDYIMAFLDEAHIRSYYPAYRQGNYLEELLDNFKLLLSKEIEMAGGDWPMGMEYFCGLHSIPIMTIHKSKGLEYSNVYFVGLEDSAFWNFKKQPAEDRCAFFVALSRAKRAITFTFCKNRSNLRYPVQSHSTINEFFELLQQPGVATISEFSN